MPSYASLLKLMEKQDTQQRFRNYVSFITSHRGVELIRKNKIRKGKK